MQDISGYFISFEGIDGSGKSSAAERVRDFLISENFSVLITHEPTKGDIGKKIYDILYRRAPMVSPFELQKLYVEDRKQHVEEVILPAIKQKQIVISDRYWLSTLAYGMLSEPMEKLILLHNDVFHEAFLKPDITFIFDLPAEVAVGRLGRIGKGADFFEKIGKLGLTRENYLIVGKSNLFDTVVIDATKSQEAIGEEICCELMAKLKTREFG